LTKSHKSGKIFRNSVIFLLFFSKKDVTLYNQNSIAFSQNYKTFDVCFYLACLHDQNKSGVFGGLFFSSQSELFGNFLNCSDWLDKSQPFKIATFV